MTSNVSKVDYDLLVNILAKVVGKIRLIIASVISHEKQRVVFFFDFLKVKKSEARFYYDVSKDAPYPF